METRRGKTTASSGARLVNAIVILSYLLVMTKSLPSVDSLQMISTKVVPHHRSSLVKHRRCSHPLLRLSAVSSSPTTATKKMPGTAALDTPWEELGFEYRMTNSFVQIKYKDGAWGDIEIIPTTGDGPENGPYVSVHIGATSLHYGQACFEGLKAFCHDDKSVHVFRPTENAARMQSSCRRIMMPELPTDKFVQAVEAVVRDNVEYVPPPESDGSLYIRPVLFGTGARIGLQPADEYTFLVLAIPVGNYYKGGLSTPVNGIIIEDYDRAAPRGVGGVKVAGNYAADIFPNTYYKKQGYPIGLYLDAQTQTVIEEFSTSNFVGINSKANLFVTPQSPSVLPSITNKSLMDIAKDIGMTVETREVPVQELETFDEVLAVGTAVVVTPVGSITRLANGDSTRYQFGDGMSIGGVTRKLYDKVRAIQKGLEPDKHGWNHRVDY
jgi:branched-chain amino acid aminotransferase